MRHYHQPGGQAANVIGESFLETPAPAPFGSKCVVRPVCSICAPLRGNSEQAVENRVLAIAFS
jgi:hypothetical protein